MREIKSIRELNLLNTFTWYSSTAQAVMTRKILGSLQTASQIASTESNFPGEFGILSTDPDMYLFAWDITDPSGYQVSVGDILYEQGSGDVYLGSRPNSLPNRAITPGSLVVKDPTLTVTYEEGKDYIVDFARGTIQSIVPTSGLGISTSIRRKYGWNRGRTFTDAEYDSTTGLLQLESTDSVYETTGNWKSFPVFKNPAVAWGEISFKRTIATGTSVELHVFPGTDSDDDMDAMTNVLFSVTITTVGTTTYTYDLGDISSVDNNDSLRFMIVLNTSDTAVTPTVYMTGTGALDVTSRGGLVHCTYESNRFSVVSLTEPGMDYHLLTLRRE